MLTVSPAFLPDKKFLTLISIPEMVSLCLLEVKWLVRDPTVARPIFESLSAGSKTLAFY